MTNSFLKRFHTVWARKQRVELGRVGIGVLVWGIVGLALVALADFVFELPRPARVGGLGLVAAGMMTVGVRSLQAFLRRRAQPMTAAEIEAAFPQLGQAVRTSVQYGNLPPGHAASAGVAGTLVEALVDATHQRALPLTIEDVVPSRRLWLAAGAFTAGVAVWAAAWGLNWEWRLATERVLLNEQPYRRLDVQPGAVTVDEGAGTEIAVALVGRTNRIVTLSTRPADDPDAAWTERTLDPQPAESETAHATADQPRMQFALKLDRLTKPLEYRAAAGELASDIYRIDIRRPVRIDEIRVELTPPAYTGQPTATVQDANLSVLEGTVARFAIRFDKAVGSAALILAPRSRLSDDDAPEEPEHRPLVLTAGNTTGVVELTLTEDRHYSIFAEAEDGTQLLENRHRIRVRRDQPPQVFFESPEDRTETHGLAEIPMRVRVRDDYGVSRAGVIFQINNEQEIPLIAEEFGVVTEALREAAAEGQISPTTQAALEQILPLEHFELTQKDSVMYYAYAEDNLPDRPQRTETDMRFLDIRPLKREYRVVDPDPMPGNGMMGISLKSLEELIYRQRFALNRTIQIEKRAAAGRKPDAVTLDELMQFETDLAQNVRETALGLESRGFDDTELFYQAESAMLLAVDSLSVGKWENATLQMKDALKLLIEQRERTALAINKNPDPARLAALRAFDRLQAQKLRRPKTDKEEARELIRRLEALVSQEAAVADALGGEEPASTEQAPAEKNEEE